MSERLKNLILFFISNHFANTKERMNIHLLFSYLILFENKQYVHNNEVELCYPYEFNFINFQQEIKDFFEENKDYTVFDYDSDLFSDYDFDVMYELVDFFGRKQDFYYKNIRKKYALSSNLNYTNAKKKLLKNMYQEFKFIPTCYNCVHEQDGECLYYNNISSEEEAFLHVNPIGNCKRYIHFFDFKPLDYFSKIERKIVNIIQRDKLLNIWFFHWAKIIFVISSILFLSVIGLMNVISALFFNYSLW